METSIACFLGRCVIEMRQVTLSISQRVNYSSNRGRFLVWWTVLPPLKRVWGRFPGGYHNGRGLWHIVSKPIATSPAGEGRLPGSLQLLKQPIMGTIQR